MTRAQRSYLQTLCEEAGEAMDETLTKAQASARIAALQQRTGRGMARGARDQAEEGVDAAGMRDVGGAADEEELEEVCPGCGLERNAWQGNGGWGYPTDGGPIAARPVPRAPIAPVPPRGRDNAREHAGQECCTVRGGPPAPGCTGLHPREPCKPLRPCPPFLIYICRREECACVGPQTPPMGPPTPAWPKSWSATSGHC
jgi:hypothetical protein